jgi:hypothetical protein
MQEYILIPIVMYSHSFYLQCAMPNVFIIFKFFDVFILDKI